MGRGERTAGNRWQGRLEKREKVEGKTGEYQEGDGGFTPEAVSVKTSIKTLPCPCAESEYISVY